MRILENYECGKTLKKDDKICKMHKRLKAEECDKYHLVGKNFNVPQSILVQVEFEQREKFRKKYLLEYDDGHSTWINGLIWSLWC